MNRATHSLRGAAVWSYRNPWALTLAVCLPIWWALGIIATITHSSDAVRGIFDVVLLIALIALGLDIRQTRRLEEERHEYELRQAFILGVEAGQRSKL